MHSDFAFDENQGSRTEFPTLDSETARVEIANLPQTNEGPVQCRALQKAILQVFTLIYSEQVIRAATTLLSSAPT
jgi:hypothetical protein